MSPTARTSCDFAAGAALRWLLDRYGEHALGRLPHADQQADRPHGLRPDFRFEPAAIDGMQRRAGLLALLTEALREPTDHVVVGDAPAKTGTERNGAEDHERP